MAQRHPDELEIVGTYFVDVYFNHIYSTAANNFKEGDSGSITTTYQHYVTAYAAAFRDDQQTYTQIVEQIYKYASNYSRDNIGASLGFNQFVDGIVSLMVPKEFFPSLTVPEKDRFLQKVLTNLVDKFSVYCTRNDMLQEIIDKRHQQPKITLQNMQDYAIVILKGEQVSSLNKFIKHSRGVKESSDNESTIELIKKMRSVIVKLSQEREATQNLNKDLVNQVNKLNHEVAQYKKLHAMQTSLLREYNRAQRSKPEPEPESEPESEPEQEPDIAPAPAIETEWSSGQVSIQDFIGTNTTIPDPSVESDW